MFSMLWWRARRIINEEMSRRTHLLLHQEHLFVFSVYLLVVDQLMKRRRGINTWARGCYGNKQSQISKSQRSIVCSESSFYLKYLFLFYYLSNRRLNDEAFEGILGSDCRKVLVQNPDLLLVVPPGGTERDESCMSF